MRTRLKGEPCVLNDKNEKERKKERKEEKRKILPTRTVDSSHVRVRTRLKGEPCVLNDKNEKERKKERKEEKIKRRNIANTYCCGQAASGAGVERAVTVIGRA